MKEMLRGALKAAEMAVELPNGWFWKLLKLPFPSFSVSDFQFSFDLVSHADDVMPYELRLLNAMKALSFIHSTSSVFRISTT